MHCVPVVGLVGGIGSGKSSVAGAAASARQSQTGLPNQLVTISGDEAGHRALKLAHVREQIRQRFGDSVFDENGEVVRPALGRVVFGPTPDHQQARRDLEAIVHPEIRHILESQIAEARATAGVRAILLDAAVLLESGWRDVCDFVVFVDTPADVRVRRVKEGRGWSEENLRKRELSQWPLDRKRAASDHVVDNSGSLDEAARQLNQVLDTILLQTQSSR